MKKIFTIAVVACISLGASAQKVHNTRLQQLTTDAPNTTAFKNAAAKLTSAPGDTFTLSNSSDTLAHSFYALGSDSGYVYGMNYWNDMAFAEHYDVTDSTRAIQVIGVMALFGGTVNPASTQAITFNVWDQGGQQPISATQYYNGFPNNILDSLVVPITQLGIGSGADTMKQFFFPASSGTVTSFFVGYSIRYNFIGLAGDTIGLASTANGVRNPSNLYTLHLNISDFGDTTLDSAITVQNATLGSDNNWYDNYTQYDSLYNNLAIYPIIVTGYPTSTKGITRNNFTLYGNYPNPCINSTDIRFSLAVAANVTVQVSDMTGKVLSTTKQNGLATGTHDIQVNTSALPAGDYIYLIRTSSGDGIAGKISVIK